MRRTTNRASLVFRPASRLGLRRIPALVLAFLLAGVVIGCAKKNDVDPEIAKWQQKAQDVQGATYTPQERKVDFSQTQVKAEVKPADEKPKRNLPVMRVSLNFYNTDLQAVLRSMARIAGQNIVLSQSLQTPENQGKLKVNLNVSETPWNQAFESILNANGLSYDWDGEIIRVMTLADMKNQNEMKKAVADQMMETERIKTVEPVVTVKIQVNYADVMELEKTLQGYLYPKKSSESGGGAGGAAGGGGAGGAAAGGGSKTSDTAADLAGRIKGYVVGDKHSNSIIIQATKEHAELLVKLVEKLDEPRLQVHLKAFIVEANRDNLFDLGFQYGGFFRTTPDGNGNRGFVLSGNNTEVAADGTRTITPIFGLGPGSWGYGFNYPASINQSASGLNAPGTALNFMWGSLSGNLLQVQLTALAREGKLNIISEPSLTTLDNMMAFTENGERIPFVTVSQNGTNVQFIDAVLRLEMTPHVIDEKNLRMKIVIKNDEVVNDQTRWVQGNPPIRKKETNTTLIVEHGSTIIISGLAKNSNTDAEQGVPGVKDVPGLGYLFKNVNKYKAKQDILVFITPTVLKSQNVAMAPQPGAPTQPSAPGGTGQGTPGGRPGSPDRQPVPMGPAPTAPQAGARPGG